MFFSSKIRAIVWSLLEFITNIIHCAKPNQKYQNRLSAVSNRFLISIIKKELKPVKTVELSENHPILIWSTGATQSQN